MDRRIVVSEFLGTLILVFLAVGSAVLAADFIGSTGIALAFGFTLLALIYALGPISGCQLNPAVTLGMLLTRRLSLHQAIECWVAQLLGGIIGALLLFLVAEQTDGFSPDGAFGSNGYGSRSASGINIFGAFVAELLMTFVLVYVWLAVARKVALVGFDGLPIGFVLAAIHLIGIPLTGTSVNPARSLGPAMFAGSSAMTQVWLFLVAPMVGGAVAALVSLVTHPGDEPRADSDRARADAAIAD